jgi:hypothetical protein
LLCQRNERESVSPMPNLMNSPHFQNKIYILSSVHINHSWLTSSSDETRNRCNSHVLLSSQSVNTFGVGYRSTRVGLRQMPGARCVVVRTVDGKQCRAISLHRNTDFRERHINNKSKHTIVGTNLLHKECGGNPSAHKCIRYT